MQTLLFLKRKPNMKINFSTLQPVATGILKATGLGASVGTALLGVNSTVQGVYGLYKTAREALDSEKKFSRPALTRAVVQTTVGLAMTGLGLWVFNKTFPRAPSTPVTPPPDRQLQENPEPPALSPPGTAGQDAPPPEPLDNAANALAPAFPQEPTKPPAAASWSIRNAFASVGESIQNSLRNINPSDTI